MSDLKSAGLLVYRRRADEPEFLLAHPGGPFWSAKDYGAWSIPKGGAGKDEPLLDAAIREFGEETGLSVAGPFAALTPLKQRSAKIIHCWLVEADLDLAGFQSNLFEMEWPRKSGQFASFPEMDRAAYMGVAEALARIHPGQAGFIREALGQL